MVSPAGLASDRLYGRRWPFVCFAFPNRRCLPGIFLAAQRSDAVAKKVEKVIGNYEEVQFITTATGFSLISGSMSSNAGFVFVSLKDWKDREKTALEVVALLNRDFRSAINEAQVFAFGPPAIPGLGNGSGFTILIQITPEL